MDHLFCTNHSAHLHLLYIYANFWYCVLACSTAKLTSYRMTFPRICHSICKHKTILSIDKLFDSLGHCLFKHIFLGGFRTEDLGESEFLVLSALWGMMSAVFVGVRIFRGMNNDSCRALNFNTTLNKNDSTTVNPK